MITTVMEWLRRNSERLSASKETLCCVNRRSAMDFDYFKRKQSNDECSSQENDRNNEQ
jgi:hypothetical protein